MIYLVSNIEESIVYFGEKLQKTKNILFIPSSIADEEKTFKHLKTTLQLLHQYTDKTLKWHCYGCSNGKINSFNRYDLIYLMGGNVTEQNRIIHTLSDKIKSYNGNIIGVSAGAYSLCDDIYLTSCHKEHNAVFILKGLSIVNVLIDVHFDVKNKTNVDELRSIRKEFKCITDNGVLVVNNVNQTMSTFGRVFTLNMYGELR